MIAETVKAINEVSMQKVTHTADLSHTIAQIVSKRLKVEKVTHTLYGYQQYPATEAYEVSAI